MSLGVRLYLLFAVAVASEAKVSSGVLAFVSPVVLVFPYRLLRKQSLSLAVLLAVTSCYYTEGQLIL